MVEVLISDGAVQVVNDPSTQQVKTMIWRSQNLFDHHPRIDRRSARGRFRALRSWRRVFITIYHSDRFWHFSVFRWQTESQCSGYDSSIRGYTP